MQTKFRLSVRWLCFAVLLAAVVVRLAAQPGLRAHLVSVAAPTQAAEDAPEPAQDGSWPTLCYEPPSHDAPDLPAVTIDNRSGLPLEPDALPEAALALDRAQEGPLVLIIHTHATEAYTGSPDFHSTDPEKSVVRVGQAIADALNARGIPTVHETALIDLGNYNDAYPRMAELAEDWMARYPSIQMVLDVHRDSLETDDGTQLALRADVDGEACAKLLLVMGSNGSGLEHPGWRQNLRFAAAWERSMEAKYPGFTRPVLFSYRFYNQDLTTGSLLIEIGGHGNNLNEALYAGQLAANGLIQTIKNAAG